MSKSYQSIQQLNYWQYRKNNITLTIQIINQQTK